MQYNIKDQCRSLAVIRYTMGFEEQATKHNRNQHIDDYFG